MVLSKNVVIILFLPLLHVNESVARTSHKHSWGTLIKRVVWNLKVANVSLNISLAADAGLRNQLLTLPIPEKDLPIRLTSEGHNHALFSRTESTRHKFLWIVSICVLNLLRKRFLPSVVRHIPDAKFAFLSCDTPLTDRHILLALRQRHMRYSLGLFLA